MVCGAGRVARCASVCQQNGLNWDTALRKSPAKPLKEDVLCKGYQATVTVTPS
jgi:hypothetical protein